MLNVSKKYKSKKYNHSHDKFKTSWVKTIGQAAAQKRAAFVKSRPGPRAF
jgi:hypothetical protein